MNALASYPLPLIEVDYVDVITDEDYQVVITDEDYPTPTE